LQEVLPAIVDKFPTIALLRVDVDLHDSTIPVYEYLYDKVAPGGYIISDDWGSEALDSIPVNGCRKATLDFFDRRGLPHPKVTQLPRATTTVWWQK
jgi:O-methyltransferase